MPHVFLEYIERDRTVNTPTATGPALPISFLNVGVENAVKANNDRTWNRRISQSDRVRMRSPSY